jgi:hypothetical protein
MLKYPYMIDKEYLMKKNSFPALKFPIFSFEHHPYIYIEKGKTFLTDDCNLSEVLLITDEYTDPELNARPYWFFTDRMKIATKRPRKKPA